MGEGLMILNDLAGMAGELNLESGGITSVGDYIPRQFGRFPEIGETMEIRSWEAKVTCTDGRCVGQIHFRRLEPAVVTGTDALVAI